ncbi:response regulator transcription factor [Marinivivus vitaminiproducens]|uniref:response regulator transcription factor n=1 Tax=Marinivivus vitaminiproducens TaxID=3035935 RepID=UPI0027A1459F|nr:response regulator [Geminicoccaceae bacterium SCSIO 64248]
MTRGDPSLVLILDDDPSIRASVESLLRSVGQASRSFNSARALMAEGRPNIPSCLVLDVRLPGQSGLEFQRELAASGIDLPIVFITGHGDVPMSVAAMKAGAIEFLTKPFRDQELLDAVHKGIALDAERREARTALRSMQERFHSLTPREREVMALVTSGQINKQIAARLQLSEITVKIHRSQMMRKMQAASLPDLVRIADRLGTMPPFDGTG